MEAKESEESFSGIISQKSAERFAKVRGSSSIPAIFLIGAISSGEAT
jgi:hypothetical protein